jgi:HAD superfamily hydrolase (TIGR01509 family)
VALVLRAIFFDVGSTLVDETGMWQRAADAAGVPRFTLMGVLGGLAARGEHHDRVWDLLGVEHPAATWELDDFFPDARPCLSRVRAQGLVAGAVGNTPAFVEDDLRGYVDIVGSSARWGVAKPAPAFFDRIVRESGLEPPQIAYVGDRVDNDVIPALAAGMVAVHIRRGPWGVLHDPPPEAVAITSLAELPELLL